MPASIYIALLSVIVLTIVGSTSRRDVVVGGFTLFFFIYVIVALIGYSFFPILSAGLGSYFGDAVLAPAVWFVGLSFACFWVVARIGHRILMRHRPIPVEFRRRGALTLLGLTGTVLLLVLIGVLFERNYDEIGYASEFPSFWLQILFKELPAIVLVLYAVARHYARGAIETGSSTLIAIAAAGLLVAIATRAGNRTDLLALILGVGSYEIYPLIVDENGGLRVDVGGILSRWRSITSTLLVLAGGVWIMYATRATRSADLVGLPAYATLLYNDYYPPAHLLLAAIAFHWVRPMEVLASNVANSIYLGRVLDVPYLQQTLGNVVVPGSSNRSFSFAYFIFTEGYMAMGSWGFIYNGIVPAVLLIPFRLLSRTSDRGVNALGAAIAAMFFANIARSQTGMILRYFFANAMPAVVFFSILTGFRLTPRTAR